MTPVSRRRSAKLNSEKLSVRTGIHAVTRTTVSTVTSVATVRSNVRQC